MTSEAAGAIASDVAADKATPASDVDAEASPAKRRRTLTRWVAGTVVAAAALAAVGVGLKVKQESRLRAEREHQLRVAAAAPKLVTPPPAPAPPPPPAAEQPVATSEAPAVPTEPDVPAMPPAAPEASAAAPAAPAGPDLTSAFAAALSATPGSVMVNVKVEPAGSIIFDRGKRIGTDSVQVGVEPGGKKTLVALRDGYQPRRFAIDSTQNSVTITLRASLPGEATPAALVPAGGYGVGPSPAPGTAPAAAANKPAAAPGKPAKKEAFDPSRDVGAL